MAATAPARVKLNFQPRLTLVPQSLNSQVRGERGRNGNRSRVWIKSRVKQRMWSSRAELRMGLQARQVAWLRWSILTRGTLKLIVALWKTNRRATWKSRTLQKYTVYEINSVRLQTGPSTLNHSKTPTLIQFIRDSECRMVSQFRHNIPSYLRDGDTTLLFSFTGVEKEKRISLVDAFSNFTDSKRILISTLIMHDIKRPGWKVCRVA